MSRVRLLSVPSTGCAAIPREWPCPLCAEYFLLSMEHVATRPLPQSHPHRSFLRGTCKHEEGRPHRRCPAFSEVKGATVAPKRGLGVGDSEWSSVAAVPSPLSPLRLTNALSLSMASKGLFSPLVPKVPLQLLPPFHLVWGISFSQQQRTAVSRLPCLMPHLPARDLLVLIHVGSCEHLTVSSVSPRTGSGSGGHQPDTCLVTPGC